MAEYHFDASSYGYVLNNPLTYIDPFGLDTVKREDVDQKKWHNLDTKKDVIALNEVTISSSKSNDNSGLYLAIIAAAIAGGEKKMYNKNTWYSLRSLRSYSQNYHGNQYEWSKYVSKGSGKVLNWAGKGIGLYNFYNVNKQYINKELQYNGRPLSTQGLITENLSNGFSTFGGMAGAGWGIGWEIGRGIASDPDYRQNIRPRLQDFLGVEREEYNRKDEKMQELINNATLK